MHSSAYQDLTWFPQVLFYEPTLTDLLACVVAEAYCDTRHTVLYSERSFRSIPALSHVTSMQLR